ncbi:MAG: carbohydrate binding domain-containing protein [Candidatus Parvarchaeota archaeon]|nr:carbohydrate binding domain-containing protein [Candidatus Jingweiarchaeum tengchongense]MCW1306178.1 carbohydrate binding domain-containing protein [Candidatus Jingweiarchaeum tengchongense]
MQRIFMLITIFTIGFTAIIFAESDHILNINVNEMGSQISPSLFGIFIEDINHAVTGGLYAELVKNSSFEYSNPMDGWTINTHGTGIVTEVASDASISINKVNPNYLMIEIPKNGEWAELSNSGYDGIPLERGESYNFSLYARAQKSTDTIHVSLVTSNGNICAEGEIESIGSTWEKYQITLTPDTTSDDGHLTLKFSSTGTYYLNMISLLPSKTFHGMRLDLLNMLKALNPGFVRFPGGCFVNGNTLNNAFNWKDSIGPHIDRPTTMDFWGYDQSYGIGLYEYLLLCEYLGAQPVFVINPGISWQGSKDVQIVPLQDMRKWVQSALDLIEFADGPATSTWGSIRASLGHPKPFDLKYIEIGNENVGQDYYERFEMFQKAIEAKYPEIKLIFSVGPNHDGTQFDDAWRWAREHGVGVVDEHIYATPDWFLSNTDRYNSYNTNGPKVMIGEYAAQPWNGQNTLEAALSEAAFMTGLEKNSDEVIMASYAPLFNRVDYSQWVPDLIWFNGTQAYGTPSYYVQLLFSLYRGNFIIPSSMNDNDYVSDGNNYKKLYYVTSYDSQSKDIIIKIVNPWPENEECQINLNGKVSLTGSGEVITLTSNDPVTSNIPFHGRINSINTFDNPTHVIPTYESISDVSTSINCTLEAYSLTILKIKVHGL